MGKEELLKQRLREAREEIPELREKENAHSSRFSAWRSRVERTLKDLFAEQSSYTKQFQALPFWETRMTPGPAHSWMAMDQEQYLGDLAESEQLLADALEDAEVAPPATGKGTPAKKAPSPQIVINIQNNLRQTTAVSVSQILTSLGDLPSAQKEEAEQLVKEFEDETEGEERWEVLGRILGRLKTMGKPVYERVALPLLLWLLKRQLGVDN